MVSYEFFCLCFVGKRELHELTHSFPTRRSADRVSRLAKSLDAIVEDFRTRPLDASPYPYLVLDALEVKCREGGRTVNACVVHAVAVNAGGFRERSEEHTSELQSLMRISYAVFCLKQNTKQHNTTT